MRGYQKRVIYMKNTGSELFEEAYFVVKEESSATRPENEIVKEANRIIRENFNTGRRMREERRSGWLGFVLFGSGFLLSALLFLVLI